MKNGILDSTLNLIQGGLAIGAALQKLHEAFNALPEESTDQEVITVINEAVFNILLTAPSRRIVEIYLIQLRANDLFAGKYDCSFDKCMSMAQRETAEFLSFANLDRMAKVIWENRNNITELWEKVSDHDRCAENLLAHIGPAVIETFEYLKAA